MSSLSSGVPSFLLYSSYFLTFLSLSSRFGCESISNRSFPLTRIENSLFMFILSFVACLRIFSYVDVTRRIGLFVLFII